MGTRFRALAEGRERTMTRPIVKTGLSALGRPCSIGAFAHTASTLPFHDTTLTSKVGSKTKGDRFIGLVGTLHSRGSISTSSPWCMRRY